ncbi:DUF1631 domain-containing protein [Halopseudomonas pelagia]|uniref:DUF1631 domain-containing protein n=1 Tax=Halopseudomonas pelagia TaxID=553151 RepID=A0AA91U0M5_9GAMM|nr:DUF1631 domain-containing protein [Halopseudomonas pelagia]PCC98450.1 thymidine phosphorylase [Halopseudomonas pelagia]QFY56093.1 DUF1631 domain-containing protein [Halopseudomonas pelagia]
MARDPKIVPITSAGEIGAGGFDPNRPSNLPSPLMPVRKQAVDFIKLSLTTLFDNADDSLFEMADRAGSNNEQTLFFEAMRAVRLQRHKITKDCCHGLMRELEALNQDADKPVTTSIHNFELDSLSLVQPDELEETVALDSMIGRAVTRNKASLSHLSIRFNSLVKRRVDDRDLPIGPAMLSQVFVGALSEMELDIKVRLIIFKLFERYVFNQVDGFYDEVNKQLILSGVLPDLKNTAGRQAAARITGSAPVAGQAYRQAEGGQQDFAEHQQVLSMFSELIGNWRHASGDAALSSMGSPSTQTLRSNELLGMLADLSSLDAADDASQRLDMRAQINQLLRRQRDQHGQSRSLERVDDDVISLVSMLFDFILDDPELPAAVKAMIGRLQLPILRVAIADKRFFSQSSHPARRLLNELARSTMGWSDQDDLRRDQLHALLESIVQRLLDQPEPDPELFASLHTELAGFINVEKRRSERLEQRTRDAEEGRARIESARTQVALSLNELLMGRTLPVFAVDLLRDTWSQVMQMTCLREGHDSEAWREVKRAAEQMLESIEPLGDGAPAEREALNARVRQSIADGLQLIGFRAEQGAPLLVKVQQLQQSRLTSPVPAAQQTAPSTSAAPQPEANDGEPLMAAEAQPAFYDAGNAQDDNQLDITEQVAGITPVASSPELGPLPEVPTVRVDAPIIPAEALPAEPELVGDLPDIKAAAWVDALHTGSWFELMTAVDAPAQRCKLAAIISFSGKYIFVNRSGVKVVEYTATSLAQHYEQGLVRLLDDNQLFDRALESVIGNLRRLQASKN